MSLFLPLKKQINCTAEYMKKSQKEIKGELEEVG